MTETWIGLLGVLIGGVLAFGGAFALEWWRQRAHGRAARVVMASELKEASQAVNDALDGTPKPHWPPGWQNMGWSESWAIHRPVLAATMSRADFDTLAKARLQMQLLQTGLAEGKGDLEGKNFEFLDRVTRALNDADELLKRLD
jgi:hypothetical protein